MLGHVLPYLEFYVVLQIEPRATCVLGKHFQLSYISSSGKCVSGIPFLPRVLLINRVSPTSLLTKFCQLGATGVSTHLVSGSLSPIPEPIHLLFQFLSVSTLAPQHWR